MSSTTATTGTGSAPPRRRWRRLLLFACGSVLAIVVLFVWNGLGLASGETPVTGAVDDAVDGAVDGAVASPEPRGASRTSIAKPPIAKPSVGIDGGHVRILAWNLAKCFVHEHGLSFSSRAEVEGRLDSMAALIRAQDPDLVFLSEVVTECSVCDVDQVTYLARATGLRYWVFGENYNFGLPFLRIVGGNAILARQPLEPVANPDLVGRRPFWVTRNNRRVLFARTRIAGAMVLLAALHTDSFDLTNNLRQTEQILRLGAGEPMLMAGDFNAGPDSASLAAVVGSGRFVGALHGPATYPADAPHARIDHVFAPAGWKLLDAQVLAEETSDHRAVVATFTAPK